MIGIIAFPEINSSRSVFPTNYVNWVESSGAKAVVIPYNLSHKKIAKQLDKLSGLIWTGGAIENHHYSTLQYNTYMNTLHLSFEIIKKYNDKGRYFPLWGTCLGFEILVLFGKNVNPSTIFDHVQSHPKSGKDCITFTHSSRLKDWFGPEMCKKMEVTPCALHHHNLGFDIKPMNHLTIVSTDSGFINMIEYKRYPFYGVQFHPERPFNAFSRKVSFYFSCFLKKECETNLINQE
jgi:gamma-glutamyl hydrolase